MFSQLKKFVASAIIVQDYPEVHRTEQNKPRRHHESYLSATSEFIFGTRTPNKIKSSANWTRLVMFKISDELRTELDSMGLKGTRIESILIDEYHEQAGGHYNVKVKYMEGIGSKVVGSIHKDEYNALMKAAWNGELSSTIF
ncbi:hypothetical protein VCHA53O466_320060 [Vibrio chagasii]|nr:hypothetical protein VCHA53O466_320060 [Vibrio chagasii]